MGQFDQFINHSDPIISKAGSDLDVATSDLKVGSLTKAEYDEICGDILDESMLASLIKDMVRLQEIYDAFKELASIVSTITSL
jgi:hypothetical protein